MMGATTGAMQWIKATRSIAMAATAIILLSGCDSSAPPPAGKAFSKAEAKLRFAQIEKLHDQSCMCRLAGRETRGVDQRLEAAKADLTLGGADAPAIPVRHFNDCYLELGRSACITTYSLHSSVGGGEVCTAAQWRAIDDVFEANGGSSDKAAAAVKKKFGEMRQAATATIPQSACN